MAKPKDRPIPFWPLTNPIPGTELLQDQCNIIANGILATNPNVTATLRSIGGYIKFYKEQPLTRPENKKRIADQFGQGRGLIPEANINLRALWLQLQDATNQLLDQIDTPPPAPPPPTPGIIEFIFGLFSGYVLTPDRLKHPEKLISAFDGSPEPATFTITESWKVTFIYTYPHGRVVEGDVTPGTIGLRAADGTTYGPWKASGKTGFSESLMSMIGSRLGVVAQPAGQGAPNEFWEVAPNVIIPPGTYTVLVSHPEFWERSATGFGIRAKFLAVS